MLQKISNWFVLALMLLGAVALSTSTRPLVAPRFVLIASVPLLVRLFASKPQASGGIRLLAMAVNWVATVLAASMAAVAFSGIGGTSFGLGPLLVGVAALYAWNAIDLCIGAGTATANTEPVSKPPS